MAKLCEKTSAEHRRKVGEGVRKAWQRRYGNNFRPKSPHGQAKWIARFLHTDDPIWAVEWLERSHREICWRAQQCVQTHKLGMGGENVVEVVCDKLDELLGKSSKEFK